MSPAEPPPGLKRAQFSLGGMLLAMLALGVTFAAAYYLVRGGPGAEGMQLTGLLLLLAAPLLLLVAVSVAASMWRLLRRRG
jgi:hypothetical protein